MWLLIFLLSLLGFMLVFNLAEAMWELDYWIANTEKRDKEGYDYENDQPIKKIITLPPPESEDVKKMTLILPEPAPEDVKKMTLALENFPKSAEDAKAKIDRLMKKTN